MFKEIEKLTLITISCFLLAVLCLTLNVVHRVFNLLFLFFIISGLTLVFVKKLKDYKEYKEELASAKESVIIDMTLSNDGSIEMIDNKMAKKQMREFKSLKNERKAILWIILALLLLSLYMAYRIIKAYYFA